jgi:hypothetical protein
LAEHAQERGLDTVAPHLDAADLQAGALGVLEHEPARRVRGQIDIELDQRVHLARGAGLTEGRGELVGIGLDLDRELAIITAGAAQLVDRAGEP